MTVDELEISRFKNFNILKMIFRVKLIQKFLKLITQVRIWNSCSERNQRKTSCFASEKAEKILVEEQNKRIKAQKFTKNLSL